MKFLKYNIITTNWNYDTEKIFEVHIDIMNWNDTTLKYKEGLEIRYNHPWNGWIDATSVWIIRVQDDSQKTPSQVWLTWNVL